MFDRFFNHSLASLHLPCPLPAWPEQRYLIRLSLAPVTPVQPTAASGTTNALRGVHACESDVLPCLFYSNPKHERGITKVSRATQTFQTHDSPVAHQQNIHPFLRDFIYTKTTGDLHTLSRTWFSPWDFRWLPLNTSFRVGGEGRDRRWLCVVFKRRSSYHR